MEACRRSSDERLSAERRVQAKDARPEAGERNPVGRAPVQLTACGDFAQSSQNQDTPGRVVC